MPKPELAEQQPSRTLAKGLLILEAFSIHKPEWGVRELARELNMSPATVARLLATLQNMGYLEQFSGTQQYRLGPMAMRLGNIYAHHNPLPTQAQNIFEQYVDRFAYNFYLGILDRDEVIYLAALDGRGPIKVVVSPGGATGLHSTALGKVLLAYQGDDYIRQIISSGLGSHTPNTVTHAEDLWGQINEIRTLGYAINIGEQFEDIGAVGVPVRNTYGDVVAGVSLAYPQVLIQNGNLDLNEIIELAKEVGDAVTALKLDGIINR